MTITDNGRRTVDELVAEARGMAKAGRVPSPTALKTALRIGWERATEVHEAASRSIAIERESRRRESRKTLKRLSSKRRPGRPVIVASTPSRTRLDDADSLAVQPVAEQVPEGASERVEDGPAEPASPLSPAYDYAVPIGPMPVTEDVVKRPRRPVTWPLLILALPAFTAVWSGWVGLGRLTGFGVIQPFPGIPGLEHISLDTAITLPVGVETYGGYALYVWLSGAASKKASQFAMWSAIGSLALGAAGQVAYHLMAAAGVTHAPWQITTAVACLPVVVLFVGAALRHLVHGEEVNR